jgi:hypothetical protein
VKRRLAVLALSLSSLSLLVAGPAKAATQVAAPRPAATAGCLWVLTIQVCIPNLLA